MAIYYNKNKEKTMVVHKPIPVYYIIYINTGQVLKKFKLLFTLLACQYQFSMDAIIVYQLL